MTDWSEKPLGIWTCKIGEAGVNTETGLDFPMRKAVEAAYREITGRESDFIFSGWRGELTEQERAVVENRLPVDPEPTDAQLDAAMDALDRALDLRWPDEARRSLATDILKAALLA